MTQQGRRQASARAIASSATSYDGDLRAMFEAEAVIPAGATFNSALLIWLQTRLGSSDTNLPGLMAEFAEAEIATNWSSVGHFGPATIPDLVFWYDMGLSTLTDTGGGVISDISDLSGNGNHATQATAGSRAVLATNVFGDLPALEFTSDFYECASLPVSNEGTYFAAVKADTLHAGGILGRGCQGDANAGATLASAHMQMIIGDGVARIESSVVNGAAAGAMACPIGRWNTSEVECNTNGAVSEPNVPHSLGSLGTAAIRPGNTNQAFDGKIGAAGYYSRRLTDQEVAGLMAYLQGGSHKMPVIQRTPYERQLETRLIAVEGALAALVAWPGWPAGAARRTWTARTARRSWPGGARAQSRRTGRADFQGAGFTRAAPMTYIRRITAADAGQTVVLAPAVRARDRRRASG
jgi:hypothetical protein